MILAPVADPVLRAAIRKAALPEEDVFFSRDEVRRAARLGFPRLLVFAPEEGVDPAHFLDPRGEQPAVLALTRPTLQGWEMARRSTGLAVGRIDDSALRLRVLMRDTAGPAVWVDGLLKDVSRVVGRSLPLEFRGLARRVLEYPARYHDLHALADLTGLSRGALKARFRRRGLPSPARYLRWLRILAASHVLRDPLETTLTTSFRLGFASDGNFCRCVQGTAGTTPSRIRTREGRMALLVRFVEECLDTRCLAGWEELRGLFFREAA